MAGLFDLAPLPTLKNPTDYEVRANARLLPGDAVVVIQLISTVRN